MSKEKLAPTIVKMKIGLINRDGWLMARGIDGVTVKFMREALRIKRVFPPLVVWRNGNILICGYRRITAYEEEYGLDYEADVILMDFESRKDAWRYACEDNITHGQPYTPHERKCIALKAKDLGIELTEIAKTLQTTVDRIESYLTSSAKTRKLSGNGGSEEDEEAFALKHGFEHLEGKLVSEQQREWHDQHGSGMRVVFHANQIIGRIEQNLLDWDNAQEIKKLQELVFCISEAFKSRGLTI